MFDSLCRRNDVASALEELIDLDNGAQGRRAAMMLAGYVLEEFKRGSRISCAPYDPRLIAALAGIEVVEIDGLESGSGSATYDGNSYAIQLRRSENEGRKRFTCAHELGHVLCQRAIAVGGNPSLPVAQERQAEVELRCNLFGDQLLMPQPEFGNYFQLLDRRGLSAYDAAVSISRHFSVTLLAAVYRAVGLRLRPRRWVFLLMKYREHPKPGNRNSATFAKLRVVRAVSPPTLPYIPPDKGVDGLGLSIGREPLSRLLEQKHLCRKETLTLQRVGNRSSGQPLVFQCEAVYRATESPAMGKSWLGFLTLID